ncbi:redoxin domain-containing protein [Bizionia paragorgiae]|uniref:redoxin domain-containing protein n=1 Tax=Bizionia paragorgiae TaxID=283786 RepID=UPI003A90EC0F
MIKKLALLSLILLGFSCEKQNDAYEINGVIDSSLNNKVVSIHAVYGIPNKVIDTDTIKDGTFKFSGKVDAPEGFYMSVESLNGVIPIILENKNMSIEVYKDSLHASKVSGSRQNDFVTEYNEAHVLKRNFNTELRERYTNAQKLGDKSAMDAVKQSYDSLMVVATKNDIDFIKSHHDAIISGITLERLVKTNKVDEAEFNTLYENLSDVVKNSGAITNIKTTFTKVATPSAATSKPGAINVGNKAPNFSGFTPEGEAMTLSDIKAKVTVIDFWASWCRPCRVENPNVVKMYNKYNSKGLEIIGVSLDKASQKDRWIKAIADDKLTWPQVSNLEGWKEPIAVQYGVRSIPATVILDENGVIVAKNLRGQQLEDKVAELLQ